MSNLVWPGYATTWRRPKDEWNGPMGAATVARKIEKGAWQKWFAWHPVKIQGRRAWMTTVYRRKINTYVDFDDWSHYEYGTIFDLIKGE